MTHTLHGMLPNNLKKKTRNTQQIRNAQHASPLEQEKVKRSISRVKVHDRSKHRSCLPCTRRVSTAAISKIQEISEGVKSCKLSFLIFCAEQGGGQRHSNSCLQQLEGGKIHIIDLLGHILRLQHVSLYPY